MTSTPQPPVTGQDINVAARAVRKVLDAVLAEQGTSFAPATTLNAVATRGPSAPRAQLVRFLSAGLEVDDATVLALLRHLETRGLIRPTSAGGVELTGAGEVENGRLRQLIAGVAAELYTGFDADELATTRRVLVTVTERASARLEPSLA